jgi:hypothetical protein
MAQQRGRSIEFSETRSDAPSTTTTNLESTTRKPLRNLNQAVQKPFDIFNGADAFNGTLGPPQQYKNSDPNMTPRRMRELKKRLERERDWVFMSEDDMLGKQTPEEMLNLEEYDEYGVPKSKKSRLELYYERMHNAREAAVTNRANAVQRDEDRKGEGEGSRNAAVEAEKRSIFANAPDAEAKRPVVSDSNRSQANQSSLTSPMMPATAEKRFADFFGFSSPEPEKFERSAASQARMQEFRDKVIEYRAPAAASFAAPAPSVSAPTFSAGSFGSGGFAPSPAPAPPVGFSSFSAPATRPYSTPSVFAAPPPAPSYRPAAAPTFDLPKRKF